MSLPPRKKSAEEIAKLRESLGILAPPPGEEELPVEGSLPELPSASEAVVPEPISAISKTPEPSPTLPVSSPLPPPSSPKLVRSLRKSEQGPRSAVQAPASESRLPVHRHSDEQLNRIRRQEVLDQSITPLHPLSLTAHPLVVIPGYVFALAGAACFYFYDIEKREMPITIGCVIAALAIAIFIFLKKPFSRHHAAFIAMVSLLVIVFGALYYFPQLRHGT